MIGESPRTKPSDLEAERALLGAVLLKPSTIDDVAELVKPSDFYRPAHQTLFEVMRDMRSSGVEIDHISLRDKLQIAGALDAVGGAPYLLDLSGSCSTATHAKRYAEIIRQKSLFRALVDIGVHITAMGFDGGDSADVAVSESVNLIMGISAAHTSATLPVSVVGDELLATLRMGKQDFLYPWCLPCVHIKKGQLVVIGAAPSVGKTALALALADQWGQETRATLFEYEMSEADLLARLAARYSGVSVTDMDNGLSETQLQMVEFGIKQLQSRKLRLEAVHCNINTLLGKIRREAQNGTKVIFIDHLGLIPFDIPKGVNHAKAVGSQVTNKLKRLATELGITIVLLSQIKREGYGRVGGIPRKEDLRDSGEIEADADIIIMVGREPLMMEDSTAHVRFRQQYGLDPWADDAKEFSIIGIGAVKNRNGTLSEKWMRFYGDTMIYTDVHQTVSAFKEIGTAPQETTVEQGSLLEPDETGGTLQAGTDSPQRAA